MKSVGDPVPFITGLRSPGRIHRYGQKHDPVVILNLIAPKTREGRVLQTLLDKLERIREELHSDKVFDVIGRLFEGVSIKQYMEMAAVENRDEEAVRALDGKLTKEQVEALAERERTLYGSGGDVAKELPRLREDLDREMYQRLLPGYVRQYFENAAPPIGIDLVGDAGDCFSLRWLGGTGWPRCDGKPCCPRWPNAKVSCGAASIFGKPN